MPLIPTAKFQRLARQAHRARCIAEGTYDAGACVSPDPSEMRSSRTDHTACQSYAYGPRAFARHINDPTGIGAGRGALDRKKPTYERRRVQARRGTRVGRVDLASTAIRGAPATVEGSSTGGGDSPEEV